MRNPVLVVSFLALCACVAWPQEPPPPAGDAAPNASLDQPRPDSEGIYFAVPGVIPPVVIERAPVEYPSDAADSAVEGVTVLKLVVTEEGAATDIQVISSHGDAFDQAAIDALKRCKFDPATVNGKPVPIHVFARVRFFAGRRETYPRILSQRGLGAGPGGFSTNRFDKPPVVTYLAPAVFSEKARRAKYQGVVLVSTVIDEQGNPTDIKVVRSVGMGLDEKAIESVRKSRFLPAMKDGKPVAAQITIEVNFRLY